MVLGLGSVVYSRVDATNQSTCDLSRIVVARVVYGVSLCMRISIGFRGRLVRSSVFLQGEGAAVSCSGDEVPKGEGGIGDGWRYSGREHVLLEVVSRWSIILLVSGAVSERSDTVPSVGRLAHAVTLTATPCDDNGQATPWRKVRWWKKQIDSSTAAKKSKR
jgi:hypothetical protein